MPRWPANHKKRTDRDYKAETAYENRPEQVKRRMSRNKARNDAQDKGLVHKGDGKEVDHIGFHRRGSLAHVPTRVVSKRANRSRQPPRG